MCDGDAAISMLVSDHRVMAAEHMPEWTTAAWSVLMMGFRLTARTGFHVSCGCPPSPPKQFGVQLLNISMCSGAAGNFYGSPPLLVRVSAGPAGGWDGAGVPDLPGSVLSFAFMLYSFCPVSCEFYRLKKLGFLSSLFS